MVDGNLCCSTDNSVIIMASFRDKKFPIVPYGCLYIDASWNDVLAAIPFSIEPSHHRSLMEYKLDRLWNHAHAAPSPILPCLSVRTAFDLFLSVKKYPRGSEMIFCAINIPDMARIVRHHGIKLVALDVDIDTMAPKVEHLESLITPKTVGILVAHLYGRWTNLEDIITIAKRHHLDILEDCAEAFCGVQNHGHPDADVSFFSFGLIKASTAFGGAIAEVRNPSLLSQMRTLYHSYPIRARSVYLKKVLKYSLVMTVLNSPFLVKHGMLLLNALGVNHRELIVQSIRGFPKDFFNNIRMRPSITLLCMLYRRLKNFDSDSFNLGIIKGDFVSERLPPGIQGVGLKATKRNYWLFPIVVDDPERVMKELNSRGVDAYKGATQLNLIESDDAIPRKLSDPSERVHQGLDHSSETAEDASKADKATSCDSPSGFGESGEMAGSVQSRLDHGRGFLQGHWKAEDVHSTRTSPLTTGRKVPEPSESFCDHGRELHHRNQPEESPGLVKNSIESGTASRTRTNRLLRDHVDDTQDVPLQHFHGERAKCVSIHSEEATGKSNNISRGLTWVAQSQISNNQSIPCTTSPSSSGPYRNTGTPSESQEQSHFDMTCDSITAITAGSHPLQFTPVSHCGTPSTSRGDETEDLSLVTLSQVQHQHVHHESHTQSLSEGSSADGAFLQSGGTNNLDTPPGAPQTMNHEHNCHSANGHTLNHPPRIKDTSYVNHSSDTTAAHSTNTQRLPVSPSSNTDPLFGGGSQVMPEQSGKSPTRTLGDSPSVSLGKYPNEARYLIDHVVYLPVNKTVSFHYLEQICAVLEDVASMLAKEKRVKLQSKL